ncbi:P-loop containing nucleoside triphosphate hydrolase protein, partial [Piptocephalis cylindrospora]
KPFTYDVAFSEESTQEDVFSEVVTPLMNQFFDGYNATILAYGQTSSGKTHTMGTGDPNGNEAYEDLGIVPRAVESIFQRIAQLKAQGNHDRFTVRVSYLEIYNEDLRDLLVETDGRVPVQIREDPKGRIYWTGVQEILVRNPEDVMNQLSQGSWRRQTGSTEMNAHSSRSHAIFSITLKQERGSGGGGEEGAFVADGISTTTKFHFVDLAGSERLKRTNAVGDRAKEGISINAGLSALGNVISALGDPSKRGNHIPYRDSKLTRLLQDSLGGSSATWMIACVSPAMANLAETLNTLKYANRARNIRNRMVKNEE